MRLAVKSDLYIVLFYDAASSRRIPPITTGSRSVLLVCALSFFYFVSLSGHSSDLSLPLSGVHEH